MLHSVLQALYDTSFAEMMRDSLWGYPIAEIIHHFGIVILFASIILADLRFIGLGRQMAASSLTEGFLLRATWVGFATIVLSGLCLFSAYAPDTINSTFFQLKLALIATAGVNMLFFTFRISKGMTQWDSGVASPQAARFSAGLSIVLWTLTIFAGRLIAYPEILESAA